MRYLILFSILIVNTIAHAKVDECEKAMTPDDRLYHSRMDKTLTDRDRSVLKTQLLSETLNPMLRQLHDEFVKLPPEKIKELVRELNFYRSDRVMRPVIDVKYAAMGVNGIYPVAENYSANASRPFDESVGHTLVYDATLRRMMFAISAVHRFDQLHMQMSNESIVTVGRSVLTNCSYTRTSLFRLMRISALTTHQTMSQFLSDEVPGLSGEDLLKAVTSPRGRLPSLTVLYSLMLGPGVLGTMGSSWYVKNPLVVGEKGVEFSQAMKDFLKAQRIHTENRERAPHFYEHGHGCPVGHNFTGDEKSGLQYYIDAVMHAYEVL